MDREALFQPWKDMFMNALQVEGPNKSPTESAYKLFCRLRDPALDASASESDFNQAMLDSLLGSVLQQPKVDFVAFTRCIPASAATLTTAGMCFIIAKIHKINVDPGYNFNYFVQEWMDIHLFLQRTPHKNAGTEAFWHHFFMFKSRVIVHGFAEERAAEFFEAAQQATVDLGDDGPAYASFLWEERARQVHGFLQQESIDCWNLAIQAAVKYLEHVVKTMHPVRGQSLIYNAKREVWRLGNQFYDLFPEAPEKHVLGWEKLGEFSLL